VAHVGRAVFYCGKKTRGEYDLTTTELEKNLFKIKARSE
jgi:hypothetical protein